jgi:hypothetical protein
MESRLKIPHPGPLKPTPAPANFLYAGLWVMAISETRMCDRDVHEKDSDDGFGGGVTRGMVLLEGDEIIIEVR